MPLPADCHAGLPESFVCKLRRPGLERRQIQANRHRPHRRGVIVRPVKHAFFPDEEKARQDQHYKRQHFKESKHLELLVNNCPWIKEDGLNIEKNEEHRYKVELYAEALL